MDDLQLLTAWSEPLIRAAQVLLIVLLAWLVQRIVTRGITRLGQRYPQLPSELMLPLRGLLRWMILGSAFMLVLERFGVSAEVLWTALTGFAAVAAVAFFAIWSVLSNMFCAVLIFSLGPFRMGDKVEVVESADKPGVKGRVIAINLFYTTLEDLSEENHGALVQVPNSLFFQKAVRRWR
ncbi:mechanosensitive ion channel family protein [Pseudomonas sp. JS3066]|jgi:small-conductance mechanosensitive channel|uniref:mechanosensitive ion channel family protein n=1 Tax=unclassified Pseudomonas TaxID=196821 RepID=UPI000EAA5788|nr:MULTISPECIES: mechanosensitive ion channel family protein [unclassified Pseudomonas]AYF89513.1 mechanosensitive ion channel family protein [Pseudomonas sp. DY-1]MDH4656056.1 mechanosensitive ion channel family protein [Pseudomonas sp. BN606]MRK21335.1 mechanosensitive ion channel family protein [Pseudomonas sp. JG-B]WVK92933.1 mechanosensitive ion channel family protein [Pseudomonas sp. JS3066]